MKIAKKTRLGAALAAAATVGTILITSTPAYATASYCTISGSAISCTTATLPAHSDHWVTMYAAVPLSGTTRCSMIDADNGITVGIAVAESWRPSWADEWVTVNGLYGRYMVHCTNSTHTGYGKIYNS